MKGILGPVLGALVHNVGSVVVLINSGFLLYFISDTHYPISNSYNTTYSNDL